MNTREVDALIRELRRQKFTVTKVKNGHWKCVSPDGRSCQIPATPRYPRAILNARTRLKRIGFLG